MQHTKIFLYNDVASRKTVKRDDFDFLELTAETSAIAPNR
jgi:hypothetical protein